MTIDLNSSSGSGPLSFKRRTVKDAAKKVGRLADPVLIEADVKRRRYDSERQRKDMSAEQQAKLDEEWRWFNAQPMADIYDLKDRDGNCWHDVMKRKQDLDVKEYLALPAEQLKQHILL